MTVALAEASADCEVRYSQEDYRLHVETIEQAIRKQDQENILTLIEALRQMLPCASEALASNVVGSIHRMMAYESHLKGDEKRAREALMGAQVSDRHYEFPEDLLPTGHPLRVLYEGDLGHTSSLYAPAHPPDLKVYPAVNGIMDGALCKNRASFVQLWAVDKGYFASYYVWPGEKVEAWMAPLEE